AGRDVYHTCHLLTAKRRVKANAAPVYALWCEIDDATTTIPPHLRPTAQVASGSPGHTHCYWRLTAALAPAAAERLNQALRRPCASPATRWRAGRERLSSSARTGRSTARRRCSATTCGGSRRRPRDRSRWAAAARSLPRRVRGPRPVGRGRSAEGSRRPSPG